MKKIICCFLVLVIFSSMLSAFSAQNKYSEEEGYMVSLIYEGRGPAVTAVLNRTVESLSEEEKISICIEKLNQDTEYVTYDINYSIDELVVPYNKIFGEELVVTQGERTIQYGFSSISPGRKTFLILNSQRVVFDREEYVEGEPIYQGFSYLKDYKFDDKDLEINIDVVLFDSVSDEDRAIYYPLIKDYHSYIYSAAITPLMFPERGYNVLDGYCKDMNYFAESVDRTIIDKISSMCTTYTMKYHQDDNGEWHWVSCTLASPETSDNNQIVYFALLSISIVGIAVIYLKCQFKKQKS